MMPLVSIAALSYLLGSIPFGYLLVRLVLRKDVRESGSGNIGATNVARTSPALGIVTLLLDAGKGLAAVLIARHFHAEQTSLLMSIAALFAVIGHLFPVWLRFRGGKGVATAVGSLICITPKSVVVAVVIFLLVLAVFRYVSLGSILATMSFPLLAWRLDRQPLFSLLLIACMSVLIVGRHHANIRRLTLGTESRFAARRG